MKKTLTITLTVFLCLTFIVTIAQARKNMLSGVNDTCGTSYDCGICHVDPKGGGPLTPEGEAYFASGNDSCSLCTEMCGGSNCTDADADGFSIEGGDCGPVDCDDSVQSINPDSSEICDDSIDNDCDGKVDCLDNECDTDAACIICTDNDNDGYYVEGNSCGSVDCNDNDLAVSPGAVEHCTDTIDNDCDGLIDCSDADCNDDPDCATTGCIPEASQEKGKKCSDGVDNDCDDVIDSDDPDCGGDTGDTGGTEGKGQTCSDLIDNDGDGQTDCDDSDCSRNKACK